MEKSLVDTDNEVAKIMVCIPSLLATTSADAE